MSNIGPRNVTISNMEGIALEVVINLAGDHIVVDNNDDNISVLYTSQPSVREKGNDKSNPISVESYSDDEDKDLGLVIMESAISAPRGSGSAGSERRNAKRVIDLSLYDSDDDDDVQVINWLTPRKILKGEASNSKSKKKTHKGHEIGASVDGTFMCHICVDEKPKASLFRILGCTHSYCSDCMVKYVASKLQENLTNISCPVLGCVGKLELEHCRSILPPKVFNRWGDALCESLFLPSQKYYCPFKDCSALLIDERGSDIEVVPKTDCPYCRRLFCVECRSPWHQDISCADFQKLNGDKKQREDVLLINLAKEKKWKRCPICKFYVEKSHGCMVMKCRCTFTFCYECGDPFDTENIHYCKKSKD